MRLLSFLKLLNDKLLRTGYMPLSMIFLFSSLQAPMIIKIFLILNAASAKWMFRLHTQLLFIGTGKYFTILFFFGKKFYQSFNQAWKNCHGWNILPTCLLVAWYNFASVFNSTTFEFSFQPKKKWFLRYDVTLWWQNIRWFTDNLKLTGH